MRRSVLFAPVLDRYRRSGATAPFGDPTAYHGVAMEGYYWRFTDRARGRVVVALLGVSVAADGGAWGTIALCAHPGGLLREVVAERAWADPGGLGVTAHRNGREVFAGDADGVRVDLGDDARLQVEIRDTLRWPHRAFGGIGPAQSIPALSQYWHPHLLGGRAHGRLELDGASWDLDGAQAYGEKNWGGGRGFPPAWWWGQSHGFEDDGACVAFAGGRAGVGPLQAVATSLVVAVGGRVRLAVRPPGPMRVRVDERGWVLRARTARHRLEVEANATPGDEHVLPVPVPAERRTLPRAHQHLAGEVRARVTRRGGRVVWEGESGLAGLERGRSL